MTETIDIYTYRPFKPVQDRIQMRCGSSAEACPREALPHALAIKTGASYANAAAAIQALEAQLSHTDEDGVWEVRRGIPR